MEEAKPLEKVSKMEEEQITEDEDFEYSDESLDYSFDDDAVD